MKLLTSIMTSLVLLGAGELACCCGPTDDV